MKNTTLLILFVTTNLTTYCSGQSLTGKWKLLQVVFKYLPDQEKNFTMDLTKPDKIKADLYSKGIVKKQSPKTGTMNAIKKELIGKDTTVDVNTKKADIDKYVSTLLNSYMTLKANNTFQMASNGLIIPTAIPGWHLGDKLKGKWSKFKDTLILTIGRGRHSLKWKFVISQITSKDLSLQEVFEAYKGRGNELHFTRQ